MRDRVLSVKDAAEAIDPSVPTDRFADLFVGVSPGTPQAAERLAAGLHTLEMVRTEELRTTGSAAARAEQLALTLHRPDLQMRARLIRADVLRRDGDAAESGRIAQQVNAWATEQGDAYLIARSHLLLAGFFRHVGDLADALTHAVQAVAHTEPDVPARLRARHLQVLAMMLHENGSPEESQRRAEQAHDIAAAAGDHEMVLQILNNMAYSAYENGEEERVQELLAELQAVSARHGLTLGAHILDTVARIELSRGNYAEAEAALHPVLTGDAEYLISEGMMLATALLTAAEAQRLRGDFPAAQATLDRAALLCDARGVVAGRAHVRHAQAQLYAATGRYREAYEEFERFYAAMQSLLSAQREARARAMQAMFENEEARRDSARFRELAERDPLTGLYNRRYIDERLAILIEHAIRAGTPISAALVDLDHFKRVNDTLSHATGDAVLIQIAGLLADAAAGSAVAGRLGGEEFVLVFPDIGAEEAHRRCEQLREAIAAHDWQPITGRMTVTASLGLTTAANGQTSPSALLAAADRNLYAAKRTGRNRVMADPVTP
ncbi:GGDEF domain-containing protein [Krasilnikovia cinnamomea]|uniref:GGDEF domain-containing protein n=1 Tax=Krasilnikovia cinnamomea TaxID=349313 RepID=UPI00102C082D|nr:GGDEF domain-containing protein [Krasilnikovia cinnamomea]